MADSGEGFGKGGQPTPFVNAFDQIAIGSLRYNTSQAGSPLPIAYGTTRISVNFLEFWGYQTTVSKGTKGGGGGGKGKSKQTPNSSVYVALGICQGPVSFTGSIYGSGGNNRIWANAGLAYGPGNVGLNAFSGTDGQLPDPVFTASDPNTPVIGYSGTCYCTGDPMQLGQSTAVPNISFEITGFEAGTIGTNFPDDARPDYIVIDLLTNSRYGAGLPAANLDSSGSLADFGNYCQAVGLAMSLLLDRCQSAASWVDYICKLTVAAPFVSGAVLKIVPYALTSYSGSGVNWSPNLTIQYSVADRDLLDWGGESDPVITTRDDPTQATNWFGIEYWDASNAYNPNVAYGFDQGAIDQYGLRNEPVTEGHAFTNITSATASAYMQLQRKQLILNKYKFKLGWVFALLEPMDFIEITDIGAGLSTTPVRITGVTENDNNELEFEAEVAPGVPSSTPAYSMVTPASQTPGLNEAPGPVNTPIMFGMPIQIAFNQSLAFGISLSGSVPSAWGGCFVWLSTDGNTYAKLNTAQTVATRMGVTILDFPIGPDPDTTNSLLVNISESAGQLSSATDAQADADVTPCVIGTPIAGQFEWISYSTATLTSAGNYTLSGYIRRGQFSSQISDHPSGSAFARVDENVYQVPYQASQIGQTVYLKFQSFNIFGYGVEDLADLTVYEFVLPAPPPPPDVTDFYCSQNGTLVEFSWAPVDYPTVALAGYDMGYAPEGTTNWNDFEMILEASNITYHANASIPPGSWTFGIRATNLAHTTGETPTFNPTIGLSPDITFANLTVTHVNPIIYEADEAATVAEAGTSSIEASPSPSWGGTLVNLIHHYTDVLTPEGTKTVDQYVQISAPSTPTTGSASGGALGAATYYVVITYVSPSGETTVSSEKSQAVAANNLLTVASPSASGNATGYNVYVSTSTGTETLQNSSPIAIGTNWTEPTSGLVSGASPPTVNTTGWDVFNVFVPDISSSQSYTTGVIDTSYNADLRVYQSNTLGLGFGQTSTPTPSYYIDTWLTGQTDPGTYTLWTIGFIEMRYLKAQLSFSGVAEGNGYYISSFIPTIDTAPESVSSANVVIAPGGTTISFIYPFHNPPQVTATVVSGGTGLYVTVVNVTAAQATFHVWNSLGVDVGGTINYVATGE